MTVTTVTAQLGYLGISMDSIPCTSHEMDIHGHTMPEMSRAERAGRAKKNEQFPLSCRRAAPPRRGSAIGRSSIVTTLERKSHCITPFGLYPASRVSGHDQAGLGKSKLLLPTGQTQAHGWGVGY